MRGGGRCLLIAVALLLLGCPREEPRLTVAVGGAPAELAFWEEILGEFQEKRGISLEILHQPTASDQRRQGLIIPLKAGMPDPDLFLMDVAWMAQFAASGWLESLGKRLEESRIAPSVFFPRILNLVDLYEGDLVALPLYIDGGLLYYRRDLLERHGFGGPPETWADLLGQAGVVQEEQRRGNPGFSGFVWQGAQYEGLICTFLEFARSAGGGLPVENGMPVVDQPANEAALTFMRDLIHRFRISPPSTYTEMQEEEVREAFQRGDALFERNWPYAWALHQEPGSPVRGKVGIAPLPHFPGGESASTLGGWHLGLSRFSDRKEDAWQLAAFLVSYTVQREMALRLGWNPGRRDVYGDPQVLSRYPHFRDLRVVFEHAVPRPVLPYYTPVSTALQRHLNAALADQVTPAEALQRAESEIGEIAKRYQED